jgi:NADPH2:quinone reductase
LALYARGAIKPAISERFTLAEGGQAITALAERRAQGKLVVTLAP